MPFQYKGERTMTWSVKERKKECEPDYLFQVFSEKEWEEYPFAGEEKLQWFRDARLGLFFHVGISAVGGVDIGWPRQTHKLPDPGQGTVPDEVYDSWAGQIKMENFHAEEWIDLAIKGGFRYVVIITKHHDGFHMWDTAWSEYKITNAPMGRDYLKELIDACHERKMPVGLYYSQRDWHHEDYEPVDAAIAERSENIPFYRIKDGQEWRYGKRHPDYIRYLHRTVLELMKKYGKIDILWWDACWFGGMFTEPMWETLKLEKEVRKCQPHILINNRASVPGDFDTPECRVGFMQRDRAWETCMPMGREWAWTGNGLKPWEEIMHEFLYSVCGDGNYLLSIGARPDGKIAPEETEYIIRTGKWMKQYGESIYGTRSGPWNPGNYGGSTFRGKTIYLHLLNRPLQEKLILPFPTEGGKVQEITCMSGSMPDIILEKGKLELTNICIPETCVDLILRIQMENEMELSLQGIDVEQPLDCFRKEPALYGSVLAFCGEEKKEFFCDLGQLHKATGIHGEFRRGKLALALSADGISWETCNTGEWGIGKPQLILKSYEAGMESVGKTARFIRIKAENEMKNIEVFGF